MNANSSNLTLETLTTQAVKVRELYRQLERATTGKEWDVKDLTIGLVGDVGELCQLVGAHEGVRPNPNPGKTVLEQLGHELSDVLWSVLVLADLLNVDLGVEFPKTMDMLEGKISARLP